nr:hypothetical protein [Tanacetum cinerariifolium]
MLWFQNVAGKMFSTYAIQINDGNRTKICLEESQTMGVRVVLKMKGTGRRCIYDAIDESDKELKKRLNLDEERKDRSMEKGSK